MKNLDPNKNIHSNPIFEVEKSLGLTEVVWEEDGKALDDTIDGSLVCTFNFKRRDDKYVIGIFHCHSVSTYFWLLTSTRIGDILANERGYKTLEKAKDEAEIFYWRFQRA